MSVCLSLWFIQIIFKDSKRLLKGSKFCDRLPIRNLASRERRRHSKPRYARELRPNAYTHPSTLIFKPGVGGMTWSLSQGGWLLLDTPTSPSPCHQSAMQTYYCFKTFKIYPQSHVQYFISPQYKFLIKTFGNLSSKRMNKVPNFQCAVLSTNFLILVHTRALGVRSF